MLAFLIGVAIGTRPDPPHRVQGVLPSLVSIVCSFIRTSERWFVLLL